MVLKVCPHPSLINRKIIGEENENDENNRYLQPYKED